MDKGWKIIIVLAVLFSLLIALIGVHVTSQDDITPNDEFFVVSISESPEINIDHWVLRIDGLVDTQLNLTYDDITNLSVVSEIVTLKCVDGPTGTANWTGVRVRDILSLAGLHDNVSEVVFYGADGYTSSLTIDDASDPDVLLAFEMNGETLPQDHGYPVRVVAPGKYGYKWVKWVTHMEVINYDYQGYWESRGWDDDADITALGDWWPHAVILTVAAYFGTLSVLSGFRFSDQVKFGKKLPKMFSIRFHKWMAVVYIATLMSVAIMWMLSALDRRGSFPNSGHGYLALAVTVLALIGGVSGYRLKRNRDSIDLKTIHLGSTLLGYLLLMGTIFTGLIMAGVFSVF